MSEERLYPGDWVEDLNGRKGHVQFTDLAACCVTVAWTGEHSGWVQSDLLTRIGPSVHLAAAQSVVEDLEGALREALGQLDNMANALYFDGDDGGTFDDAERALRNYVGDLKSLQRAASLPSPEPTQQEDG